MCEALSVAAIRIGAIDATRLVFVGTFPFAEVAC